MHTEHADNTCRYPNCRTTPAPGYADRGICGLHEQRGQAAIAALPVLTSRLGPLILEKPAPPVGATGGVFESSVPLNVHVEALVREIGWVTATWTEIVRDRQGRSDRIGTIADRCKTLVNHWTVFVAVRDWPIVGYHDRQPTNTDGVDGIVDLSRLHDRAEHAIGHTKLIRSVPGICPRCGRPDLRHRDTEDTLWCGHCRNVMTWNTYALHTDLLAGDTVDRLTGAPLV